MLYFVDPYLFLFFFLVISFYSTDTLLLYWLYQCLDLIHKILYFVPWKIMGHHSSGSLVCEKHFIIASYSFLTDIMF